MCTSIWDLSSRFFIFSMWTITINKFLNNILTVNIILPIVAMYLPSKLFFLYTSIAFMCIFNLSKQFFLLFFIFIEKIMFITTITYCTIKNKCYIFNLVNFYFEIMIKQWYIWLNTSNIFFLIRFYMIHKF